MTASVTAPIGIAGMCRPLSPCPTTGPLGPHPAGSANPAQSTRKAKKQLPPGETGAVGESYKAGTSLVPGYLFGDLGLARAVADFIRIADGDGSGVGRGPLDIGERADLHYLRLRLLEHEFLVNLADSRFFLEEFGAASRAVFFGRGDRYVVIHA